MKKASSWNAMSSIGVTGNGTSSGDPRPAGAASVSSAQAPQHDQGEVGESPLLGRDQRSADGAVRRVLVGPEDDQRRQLLRRPAQGLLPRAGAARPARPTRPRPPGPARPPPRPPGARGRRSRRPADPPPGRRRATPPAPPAAGLGRRPLDLRPEVDQHHEERDQLQDDVEQRRQVDVELGLAPILACDMRLDRSRQ